MGFFFGVNLGGIFLFVFYFVGLLLSFIVVVFVVFRFEVGLGDLVRIVLIIVFVVFVVVLGLIRIVVFFFEVFVLGLIEGEGFMIVLLFFLFLVILLGFLGSFFEFFFWKRDGNFFS